LVHDVLSFTIYPFAIGDIPDVALDNLVMVHRVDIADELDIHYLPVFALKRDVLISDIAVRFQLSECMLCNGFVLDEPQFPKMFADKILQWIPQHIKKEFIRIDNFSCLFIKDEYTILCSFKQAAVLGFRCLQCILDHFFVGDIPDVARDNLLIAYEVGIADKLDIYTPPISGFQRQIFIPYVAVRLELSECLLGNRFVLDKAEFPEMFSDKILQRVFQQVKNKGICIDNFTGIPVKDQDRILCSFKEAAVLEF